MSDTLKQRSALRRQLRQQRRALDDGTQQLHALLISEQIRSSSIYQRSRQVAAYLAADGEIGTEHLINHAWQSNKQVYLPVLSPLADRLYFAPYGPDSKMTFNRFGIAEPAVHPRDWKKASQLDLILMPLVGFDMDGNRLGMGGGFYDRSLAFSRFHRTPHRPSLIGLAHQLQQVEQLPHQPHDVPMQMIVTEVGVVSCS